MRLFRHAWAVLVLLPLLAGCHGPSCCSGASAGAVPPEPPAVTGSGEEGGLLLKTGAIQLGPGVGKNLWRWQGDGEGHLFGGSASGGHGMFADE
jgi:hypothetical protein